MKLIPIVAVCGTLAACSQPAAAPYKPYTMTHTQHKNTLKQLHAQGVGVVQQGDTLRLILPTDAFFEPQTKQLQASKVSTLADIARVIKSYTSAPVKVVGYTDNVFAGNSRVSQSAQLAKVVSSYLWAHGVPASRMTVSGSGAKHSVSSNATPKGAAANRRVEIFIGLG